MKQVKNITLGDLSQMAEQLYGSMVKADVDVKKGIMVVDMDMHADGEAYLLEQGSNQTDLWSINRHPVKFGTDDFIEFDSMINIRPRQDNPSRDILDDGVRKQTRDIVKGVVHE
jgi:hypothetical protein